MNFCSHYFLLTLLLPAVVWPHPLSAASPVVISEFMAANSSMLADEEGEFSDWIELHNVSTSNVSLLNWSLTDNAGDLAQWRFPATNLPPGGFLVVFASEKNRRIPGAPLHTDFKLNASGDYLALVEADGVTIASEFSPVFPPQIGNVSYGVDSGFRLNLFLPTNAVGRLLVPTSDTAGTNWILPNFDDAGWLSATSAVGYAAGSIADRRLTNSLAGYWKFDETGGNVAADSSGLGNAGGLRNFPANQSQWAPGRIGGALNFRGGPLNDYVVVTNYPKSTSVLTVSAWVWAESRPQWATIAKNWPGGNASHFHFGLQDTAGDLSNFILQNNADYGLREGLPLPLGTWQHVAFVLDATTERLYRNGIQVKSGPYNGSLPVPSSAALSIGAKVFNNGTSADSFWHGKLDEVAVWNRALTAAEIKSLASPGEVSLSSVATDTKAAMFGINATCYLRFPFVVDDPALYRRWILRMQYDDGFVVWLNGQEVARRDAPDTLAWDSTATNSHSVFTETFNLAEFENLIVAGTNLLAIQALNASADDPDFFIATVLDALSTVEVTNALAYFTLPTPGSENIPGVAVLGPIIGETVHSPSVPSDLENLVVTARVAPAFAAVTNVTLRYRVMYSNEVSVTMFDDGAHADGVGGDGVFGASIPASASTNGQMIRYAITAADAFGRTSRAPHFNDPLNSDEYFGTIVANPAIATPLPVFHWFVAAPALAETDTGTRCSLFYAGEFYDNIFIRIRGGTARGWPKKSFKVELNEAHEFLLRPGLQRVTEFDFNTTYTDKSYVRAVLAYEHQRDAGLPSPETLHVHLRQNTAFYSVALYVDTVDKDFITKWGMDENGALYKGGPGSTMDTTSSYEPKTRRTEGTADLQNLLTGLTLTGSALENFLFDSVDVPEEVNYMATMAVTQDIDGTDKNHYLHRDTLGSGEWRLLPWDLDLSFGPDALNTDTMVFQLQNTNSPACASHPFIGARPYLLAGGKYQRLIEAMVNTPRTRAMILRRTRTLTERFLSTTYFQDRIEQLYPLLNADVAADRAKWGGSAHFGGSTYTLRAALDRIKNEYLALRPGYLLGTNIAGVGLANPPSQPINAAVAIAAVEFNPSSGRQAEEYLWLTNPIPFPMDISGWRLDGAVDFTFDPGTVLPANGVVYVAADVAAFRARTAGPRGGQGLFVQGNFRGQLSARGETIRLLDQFGNARQAFTYPGAPSPAQRFLRVTEIMYHPSLLAGNTNSAEEFEFIELRNVSTDTALDLSGVRFINGIEFNFSGSAVTSLPPGGRVVVVRNLEAFTARHGVVSVAGQFTGALENGGERLQLVDASNEEIHDFSFNNSWHPMTDGLGFSLVVVAENAEPESWGSRTQWRSSGTLAGSPAGHDSGAPAIGAVRINEVLSRSDVPPPTDSIEVFNPTEGEVNISGWFLSDDFNTPKKFRIPDGAPLAAGAYRVFTEADFNPGGAGFALSSDGDEVWLFSADAAGNLTGYFHGFQFGAADDGVSFGRHLISSGEDYFVAQATRTPGGANAAPLVGPIVINEILYRPADLANGDDNSAEEFIELLNISGSSVPLFDASSTWRLGGGVDFVFPGSLTLTNGEYLLLVNFSPTNTAQLASFRAKFNIAPGVTILGPYLGQLANDGEELELRKPATPLPTGVPYVLVDKVSYRDSAPWPGGADGFGLSLQRRVATAYGNDPANWSAAPPTGGRASPAGNAPIITSHPQSQAVVAFSSAMLNVTAAGGGPLRYQWRFNGANLPGATNAALFLNNLQPHQGGAYACLVANDSGSAVSTNAIVSILYGAAILAQPQNVSLRGSTNVADYGNTTNRSATFNVSASSSSAISYQWRFNGTPLPGATGASLLVSNVTLAQDGWYDVTLTDAVGTLTSSPARLAVLLNPIILQPPVSQTVVAGSDVTFSVAVSGNPAPFRYEWRRGSFGIATNAASENRLDFVTLNSTTAGFLIASNQISTNHTCRVIITNPAQLSSAANITFTVTVLADRDRDGLSDRFEQTFFGDSLIADRDADSDGDGMSNGQEQTAGTDPTNAASYLKVDAIAAGGPTMLSFGAISNRTYSVELAEAIAPALWSTLTSVPARATNWTAVIADPDAATNRFYRLVTPQR